MRNRDVGRFRKSSPTLSALRLAGSRSGPLPVPQKPGTRADSESEPRLNFKLIRRK